LLQSKPPVVSCIDHLVCLLLLSYWSTQLNNQRNGLCNNNIVLSTAVTIIYSERRPQNKVAVSVTYQCYFPGDGDGFVKGLYPTKRWPLTARLANDLSGTWQQNRGLGGVNVSNCICLTRHIEYLSLNTLGQGRTVPHLSRKVRCSAPNCTYNYRSFYCFFPYCTTRKETHKLTECWFRGYRNVIFWWQLVILSEDHVSCAYLCYKWEHSRDQGSGIWARSRSKL